MDCSPSHLYLSGCHAKTALLERRTRGASFCNRRLALQRDSSAAARMRASPPPPTTHIPTAPPPSMPLLQPCHLPHLPLPHPLHTSTPSSSLYLPAYSFICHHLHIPHSPAPLRDSTYAFCLPSIHLRILRASTRTPASPHLTAGSDERCHFGCCWRMACCVLLASCLRLKRAHGRLAARGGQARIRRW